MKEFKQELMQEGHDIQSRLNAYKKLPQTETTKEAIVMLQCRLEMINLYLKEKYNILCY